MKCFIVLFALSLSSLASASATHGILKDVDGVSGVRETPIIEVETSEKPECEEALIKIVKKLTKQGFRVLLTGKCGKNINDEYASFVKFL